MSDVSKGDVEMLLDASEIGVEIERVYLDAMRDIITHIHSPEADFAVVDQIINEAYGRAIELSAKRIARANGSSKE